MSTAVAASGVKKVGSAKKSAKSAAPRAHPPYGDMVKKAIGEMKDRKGSSRQAIIKYIRANFKVSSTENVESMVKRSLVAGVKAGRFVNTKGAGASGSFKLPEKEKKAASKTKKRSTSSKPKAKKSGKSPAAASKKKKATPKKKVSKPKAVKKSPAKKAAAKPKRAGAKKSTPKKKVATAKK